MKNFDIVILGSGASGVMCAISASEKGKSIALIDKNKSPAKKLMATGNGRCNLSNTICTPSVNYYNRNIDKFLQKFSPFDAIKFFESLGLCCYHDDEGRVYPLSNSAKSVIDILCNKLEKCENISVFNEKIIQKVEKFGEKFKIICEDEIFIANKLVVATGGNTFNLVQDFGVKIVSSTPSLCALQTKESTKLLNGIRLSPMRVIAECDGQRYQENGEVLFKECGLSGIAIFNASCIFARKGNFCGKISLDIMPNIKIENLIVKLKERRALNVKVSKFFEGMLVNGLAYLLFERCKTNENRMSYEISDKEIEMFAKNIKNLQFEVCGFYDNNQVFSGGVDLSELTCNLQHTKHKNLFFCGEICDVDGLCGGYNLQWAWTSGYIVGKSLL